MIAVGWFSTMTSTIQSKPLLKKEFKDRFAHVGANYSATSSKLSLKILNSFNVCFYFKITLLQKCKILCHIQLFVWNFAHKLIFC
jgi:hypothetical protein